uniref:ATE_N domain-containing protein n=1 Tax=Syphacia muris TaxID=451379 RepID=A0A0N5AR91_9BILA
MKKAVYSCELFQAGVSDLMRFRRPEDLYQPPFRTILCGTHPIRIQYDADDRAMCNEYFRMNVLGDDSEPL